MADGEERPSSDIFAYKQTCMVKGRTGHFYLVKLCRKKARVIPIDLPGTSFLVNRSDLRNIQEIELSLFPEAPDPPQESRDEEEHPATVGAAKPSRVKLPPLPWGLLDLDPVVITDRGPPLRVKCYVRDCQEMLRPPKRGFPGDVCQHHGIRSHLSGNSPTYTYRQAHRNLITAHRLFSTRLRGNPHKFETHRFGYERSEDSVTWNVFRSLQEAGCLRDVLRYITGMDIDAEPLLYLWGLSMSDDTLEAWDLLLEARRRFESRLPVKRPATEPDAAIFAPNQALALIECKLGSPNTFYADGPRRNGQSLTKNELIEIYADPACQIIDTDIAKNTEIIFYQLYRNMQFTSYMSHLAGGGTLAFHANLVRAGFEHASTSQFRELIRPEFADRFMRFTWENIYTLAGQNWRKLSRLLEYMACKTLNLQPAFLLDIW